MSDLADFPLWQALNQAVTPTDKMTASQTSFLRIQKQSRKNRNSQIAA